MSIIVETLAGALVLGVIAWLIWLVHVAPVMEDED